MFDPTATYKGRLLSEMDRDELLLVLEEQLREARDMMKFVDMPRWHAHLRAKGALTTEARPPS